MPRRVETPVPVGTALWEKVMGRPVRGRSAEVRAAIDWRVPAKDAWQKAEHSLQVSLLRLLLMEAGTYPEVREIFAVPNGGDRNRIVAAKMKAEGVRRGVPDLFLDVPRGGWHGLRLELKRAGGAPSPEQWEWLERYRARGYCAVVANDLETARGVVLGYLRGEMRSMEAETGEEVVR